MAQGEVGAQEAFLASKFFKNKGHSFINFDKTVSGFDRTSEQINMPDGWSYLLGKIEVRHAGKWKLDEDVLRFRRWPCLTLAIE